MKRIIYIFLFLVVTGKIAAQDPGVIKARQILDKVSAKTRGFETISADFSLTLENLQTKSNDTYSGRIVIKGNKYKVEVMGVDTYFDGQTMWMHLEDAGEVNISEPDVTDDQTLSPANLFTMHEKGFRYLHAGETTLNGRRTDVIDLFPEKRDKPFSRVKLFIYQDNHQVARVSQIGKDGNNYIIDIKNMEVNIPVNDSMFTFDPSKNPGVELIDLR